MKTILRVISILVLILAVLLLTSSLADSLFTKNKMKKNIDVIVKMIDADFWQTVKMGADAAAKEFDVDINFCAPEFEGDIDMQIELVNQAIERKTNAIVLAACDYNKLVSVVEKAIKAKIPVIVIDSGVDSKNISSFIATDNINAGKKVADKLIEVVGDNCKIAVINSIKGAASVDERERGLLETFKDFPNIKVVCIEYGLSDVKLSSVLTRKIITENPDIDAIVGLNAMSSIGVAQTVKDLKLAGKVKVIAFDSTLEEIDYMEEGVIQATVVQNPFSMGYLGVKIANDVLQNKSVPAFINTGSMVIDKSNMYTPENQKLLFPFSK